MIHLKERVLPSKSEHTQTQKAYGKISKLLDTVKASERLDEFSPSRIPSKDDLILHCVRLAYEPLGIDVKDIDAHGDLTVSKFKYIEVEVITTGLTNILYKVTNSKNGRCIAVRIFGENTEKFIDRTKERIIQSYLCVGGLAKKIYAHFNGGQIEQWLEGESITVQDFRVSKYSECIAEVLRKLHNSPGQRELYLKLNPHVTPSDDIKLESILWPTLWKQYNLCIENNSSLVPICEKHFDLREIKAPMEKLQRICNKMNSPVVLCHADLFNDNIIVNAKGNVSFLDFEYSGFMERGFDIANYFDEYACFECDWNYVPTEEVQRRFLTYYLGDEATNEAVDALYAEIQPYFLAANLYWGLWGLLQCIMSKNNVDFTHYATSRVLRAITSDRWAMFQ